MHLKSILKCKSSFAPRHWLCSRNDITNWLWLGIIRFKVGILWGSHGVSLNLLLSVRSHVARENNATSKSTWKNGIWMMLMDKGRLEWWWDEVTCYPQIKIIYLKRISSMSGNGKFGQHETINPWWEMEKKEINMKQRIHDTI